MPPEAKPLLVFLGLWNHFLSDSHLPSYSNRSIWGNPNITYKDFIFNKYGCAWHLDRLKFDKMLIEKASKLGCIYKRSISTSIYQNSDKFWRLFTTEVNGKVECIKAEIVVDATGRSSIFAQTQGIQRIIYDRLIGIIGIYSSEYMDKDSTTLIESAPDGWWYTANVPRKLRIAVFFTYSDLPIARKTLTIEGWKKLLQDTIHIQLSIDSNHYSLIHNPFAVMANSSKLSRIIGKNWLAVGDASASYQILFLLKEYC